MNRKTRWLGWGAWALAAATLGTLSAPRTAPAQDAVVVIKSANEVLGDLRYLVQKVVPGDQAAPVLQMLDQVAGPQALKGLDRTQPIAVMASMPEGDGMPPTIVGAVPVTDLNALVATLKGLGMAVADSQIPGFSHQITLPDGNTTLFLVASGKYAFVTPIPADANAIKAMKVADWLPKRPNVGDLSATFNLDRLPDQVKQQMLEGAKQGIASQAQERKEGTSDAEWRAQQLAQKLVEEGFTRLIEDASTIALDLTVDQKGEQISAELSLTARPGTPMAEALAGFADRKSRFRPLTVGAPVALWGSFPMPKEFQELMGDLLDEARAQAEKDAESDDEKQLVGQVMDALRPTFTGDEIDFGLAIQAPAKAGPDAKYTMIGALHVVDGKSIEAVVRKAAASAKPEDKEDIHLDFAKAADGTAIHKVDLDDDEVDADTARAFGKDAAAFAAFKADTVFVAFGEDGQAAIENALAGKAPAAPASGGVDVPAALLVHLAKIAGMVDENQEETQKAADEVFAGPNAAKDRVALTLGGQGTSLRLRLFLDTPALTFFGRVGAAMGGGQGAIQIDR
jgi:hypothetical protein